VAVLHHLDQEEEKAGVEERLAALAKQGLLTLPTKDRESSVEMAEVRGEPVSETIIRDRR